MWENPSARRVDWLGAIADRERKLAAAVAVAARVRDGEVVGAGSGSTAFLALQRIGLRIREEGLRCRVVPTSREIELTASALGVPTTTLLHDRPDWCFDGADEVDAAGNMIKGRGGALYREKLVMRACEEIVILIDPSKRVARLGERFAVPVEVLPEALHVVETAVLALPGAESALVRPAVGKDGPIVTEQGNLLLDVRFSAIGPETEGAIKALTGVLECGLFWGLRPTVVEGAPAA